MDVISFSEAATANSRIEIINANPDSSSGIVTVPKVIASGETVTIPAGRVAVLPNVQVDGVLNVEGEVFIPSGATLSSVVEKVTSTDNAIVRFDGTTGAVQNSGVIINDNGNVGIAHPNPASKLHVNGNIRTTCSSLDAINTRGLVFDIDGTIYGRQTIDNSSNLLYIGAGALGYGTGSGGTVTQLTSKSTPVTLNKPSGRIVTHNTSLAAGATVVFQVNNSLILTTDTINVILVDNANYDVRHGWNTNGAFVIKITNATGSSLSEVLNIHFTIIKGAIS